MTIDAPTASTTSRTRALALLLGLALLAGPASRAAAQTGTSGGPPAPPNARDPDFRSATWPAPTEEDWAKPVLIPFQRSWEDARRVSEETGKPILVCINMDGEIASEHYAGVRYRQPEIARLYEPYVCVIASTYRHTDRDYDEQGQRVICPRFGSVTCGEHIAIEPGLHEKYMDGRRIAPRHIGVDLEGRELYDVMLVWDTDTVFRTIVEGVQDWPESEPLVRGDRSPEERVASPDLADRQAVEAAYRAGPRELRQRLIQAAAAQGERAPVDLLRLAVFGNDLDLARQAREALTRATGPGAVALLAEALRQPLGAVEREALVAALERLSADSPKAATLARVHRGLDASSSVVDLAGWATALDGAPASGDGAGAERPHAATLERQEQLLAEGSADDLLLLAESFLSHAYETWNDDPKYARLVFQDALDTALRAEALGAYGWRPNGVVAVAAHYLDDPEQAARRAETAVRAGLPMDAPGWNAMAVVALFAGARQEAIRQAVAEQRSWPSEWLTDIHAACTVLARHPHGTVDQLLAYHDFLDWLGARGQASRVLDVALERFPSSWDVHARLRGRILRERGADDLEPTYEGLLAADDPAPDLSWFAGHASRVTAEFHRRQGNPGAARAAYRRAIAHWERDAAANPATAEQAAAAITMALGGLARLSYEAGEDEQAVDELLAAFARHEPAANDLDGMNFSAVDTAKLVHSRLLRDHRDALADRLGAALQALDPALLELPYFEDVGDAPSGVQRGQGRPPGRGRRRGQGPAPGGGDG